MGELLLNFIVYIENIIGIYRNFSFVNRTRKIIFMTRIVIEIILLAIHTIIRIDFYPYCITGLIYFYLTSGNTVIVLLLALYHSKRFKTLKSHLNFGHKLYDEDAVYQKSMETKQSAFIGFVCFLCLAPLVFFTYNQISPLSLPNMPLIWHYLLEINMLMCDFRYVFECTVVYSVLYVMSAQIQFITSNIDENKFLKTKNYNDIEMNERSINEVHKWFVGYKHIRQSCKLFNGIFGLQLTAMLTITSFFYIIFLYITASHSMKGLFTTLDLSVHVFYLVFMMLILFLLSCSAQKMQNSADVLRRRLCKLLILSVLDGENYRPTKDLLRMMSSRPIRARAFGSIDLDMTLLPTCISFFTTFTVIALQFNNVL